MHRRQIVSDNEQKRDEGVGGAVESEEAVLHKAFDQLFLRLEERKLADCAREVEARVQAGLCCKPVNGPEVALPCDLVENVLNADGDVRCRGCGSADERRIADTDWCSEKPGSRRILGAEMRLISVGVACGTGLVCVERRAKLIGHERRGADAQGGRW